MALDAEGWTILTPSGDSRLIYVSATGSDSNDGLSTGAPKLTIDAGVALLRDGFPDYLYLKAGDTWTDQEIGYITKGGRSASERMVITRYGTGARPLLKTPVPGEGAAFGTVNTARNHVALVGIEFYCYKRNPADPGFTNPSSDQFSIRCVATVNNLLIEDCKFSYYGGATIEATSSNVTFRRNILHDNWYNSADGHSEGIYCDHLTNLVFEENFIDHCGWHATATGGEPTIFNHGAYLSFNNGPITCINNIFTNNSATGVQVRSGGTVTGNLIVRNPIGLQLGTIPSNVPTPIPYVDATVTGNVILEGTDMALGEGPREFGFLSYPNTGTLLFQDNVIAHRAGSGENTQNVYIEDGTDGDTYINNVIYEWGGPSKFLDLGSGNTTSPNAFDGTGYTDPDRTLDTYMGSIGQTATYDAFIAAAKAQRKGSYDTRFTAAPVVSYIRVGFDLEEGEVGTDTNGSDLSGQMYEIRHFSRVIATASMVPTPVE